MGVRVSVDEEDERPGGVRGGDGERVVVRDGIWKGSKIAGWSVSNGWMNSAGNISSWEEFESEV